MCNKETKKCNIRKGQILNPCCKKNIFELLTVLDRLFKKHNITYWLDYGTLLGAVRNADIIPYDDDGDIGVLRQDLDKILSLSDQLRLMGYHLVSWFYPRFLRLDLSRINEHHIDIFPWHFEKMTFNGQETTCLNRIDYLPKDKDKGQHFPVDHLFPLQKIRLNNYLFNAPNDPRRFAQFRYGPTWQQPIKEMG